MSMKMRTRMEMKQSRAMWKIRKRHVLLVVDDEPQVCRLMERQLGEYFDEIITETNPNKVSEILGHRGVTHVLSDFNLHSTADGVHFVTGWKREFPCIERAVIFTALDLCDLEIPEEVAAVVSKDDGVEPVIDALLGFGR